jgi:hypothetical protein
MKILSSTRLRAAVTALTLSVLACRPVLTIGTGEVIVFLVLLLALFGPPVFRLWARWEAFKRDEEKKRKK